MLIQLPDDSESIGYRETQPFQWEQVFRSKDCRFIGTELEFVKAGFAYAYVTSGNHKRIIVEI